MEEVIFLIILGGIWLLAASLQDIKTREIPNWLSLSLIFFALGGRFFYVLFNETSGFFESAGFFYQGLMGFGIFVVLGYAFYYGRIFAGGDAKLFIALGAVLGFSGVFYDNIKIYGLFVFGVFLIGAVYGFAWSGYVCCKNFKDFKKRFKQQLKGKKTFIRIFVFLGIILIFLGFYREMFFVFGFFFVSFPLIYFYAKSVDDACMIKEVSVDRLTEGDWLFNEIKIGNNKTLKPNWEGLSSDEIKEIQKNHKRIKIREGVPFVPVFLMSFFLTCWIYFSGFFDKFLWLLF